jgi:prepilin-type N-terminal cleavage/methylation domain-containing protein
MKKTKTKSAFTIVELMVAITVIAIITSISVVSLQSVRQRAADTARLSGIRDLQLAVEGYKSINGKYPDKGTGKTYIQGIEPSFITKLPQDKPQTNSSGYSYVTSADNKSYCIAVLNTVNQPDKMKDFVDNNCPKSWIACKGVDSDELVGAFNCDAGSSDLDNF